MAQRGKTIENVQKMLLEYGWRRPLKSKVKCGKSGENRVWSKHLGDKINCLGFSSFQQSVFNKGEGLGKAFPDSIFYSLEKVSLVYRNYF